MITSSIEIDRSQEEVFAYLDELDRHSEWQSGVISSRLETDRPVGVGTRVCETRQVPGGPREMTYEITERDPGPVRARGACWTAPCEPSGMRSSILSATVRAHA